MYFESYSCISDLILVLQILFRAYSGTKVPVGTTQIPYTEVPVGTTGLILVLQNLYLFYRYGSTLRYYRTYPCITELILVVRILYGAYSCTKVPVGTTHIHYTKVPVGTTGLILILPIREYPQVLPNLYLFYCYGSTRRYYRTCTHFTDTEVLVGTTEIHYMEVPVGTTGVILTLQNLYLFY